MKHDPSIACVLRFLETLLGRVPSRNFAVRLWDGRLWSPASGNSPRFTLVIRNPGVLRKIFFSPDEVSLGELYIHNHVDVEGNLEEAFVLRDALTAKRSLAEKMALGMEALRLPSAGCKTGNPLVRLQGSRHSLRRDRQAVGYHYNVSNDYYRLWLDRNMVYSCGYFRHPDDTLDTAQEQKLDYLCRKLRLKPGERLLDVGCGWGALLIHAASHYGVKADGITLSKAQEAFAAERIQKAGLSEHCSVALRDYREMEGEGVYDKIVSVGMFEHVGRERLPEYFSDIFRLLRPQGLFLNHGISAGATAPEPPGRSFINAYVFPDGELLPVSESLNLAESCGFEVRDVESLREHYTLTLRHWVRRLEERYDEAQRLTNDVICRIWKLYMAGSAYGFRTGRMSVFQALFAKPEKGEAGLPLTRDYMLT